jgi:hypothetical protein
VNQTYLPKGSLGPEVARALETPVMSQGMKKVLIQSHHVDELAVAPIAIGIIINKARGVEPIITIVASIYG